MTSILKFLICQYSNNASKCEQWFMKDLVQKFKTLVFIDDLSCLFNYILTFVPVVIYLATRYKFTTVF